MASIGLISDVHSTPEPVAEALSVFDRAGVDEVFCAGDIAGYREAVGPTVELLQAGECRAVIGNHDQGYLSKHGREAGNPVVAYFNQLPAFIETRIAGKRVYMVHAEPPDACHGGIKLLDKQGAVQPERIDLWTQRLQGFDPDVLIVGHTHQVFAEWIGNTLVVNPGSSAFNYSCAILRLPEMTVEVFPLSGKTVAKNWNWSEHMTAGG